MRQKGFTLIELLIVIALLGALAVGLLATIDPLEQLKKGRDTSLRNQVEDYYNANLRYYAIKQVFSWPTSASYTGTPLSDSILAGYTTSLTAAGELKSGFLNTVGAANLAKIYVTSTASDQMAVCYKPESKAFQVDRATMYGSSGVTSATCKSLVGPTGADCFYCIQ